MLKPSADLQIPPELSRYSLVVAVAKRARQIAEEAEARGEIAGLVTQATEKIVLRESASEAYDQFLDAAEKSEKKDGGDA